MPSVRRTRFLAFAVLAFLVLVFIFTSRLRNDVPSQDFYGKTVNALAGQGSSDAVSERLKAAEQKAKDLANQKAPLKPESPSEVIGVGSSADGQDADIQEKNGDAPREAETEEEHKAELELNSILKKSPVIIFSKTYCPYSQKAKALLLQTYTIEPTPFVVELDIHPLGPQIQALLHSKTGRKTVPNIMVNGVSIGGYDSVAELAGAGTLIAKVKDLGETRRVDMRLTA